MTLQFIAPTKRRSMTRARAARIFLEANGICCLCGNKIYNGQSYFIEHLEALSLGGADADANCRPAHTKCKAQKDAADAAAKAKRDRLVTKGWDGRRKPAFQSQGFSPRQPQRTATRKIEKWTLLP
ncbi:HNH endonuclease [Paradevosia shaoguanensis]|uniref:HNH endonuclease n=1 Tax=Paradevosia shaoguanensis TaxID=1335043 RepID=UPI001931D5C1|nr:hypothetical protein [Paradevosia shaoguanensis]